MEHGLQVAIVVDEDGSVIDGHHRKEIADRLGIDCPRRLATGLSETQKRTLALSLNLDRRHLTREQKRSIVEQSLRADPHLSNRQHAERTGVSDKTVAPIREELESTAEIPQSDTRVSADGRERPATRPVRSSAVDRDLDDDLDAALTGLRKVMSDHPAPTPVTGLDGKPYPQPEPPAPTPKRRALTDTFWNAVYDLGKKAESVHRLTEDDRFPQNAEKVAAIHRSDLIRYRDLITEVINRLPQA